jgi:Parvovirus non-structural protein NS1
MNESRADARSRSEASRAELRALFESGAVYADRFPPHVRDALDVPDELTPVVSQALARRETVVIAGNAGDGKSHLAQRALDQLPTRTCVDVTRDTGENFAVQQDAVVFIRDVSALTDSQSLAAVRVAQRARAALLITINEGPLDTLSQHPDGDFFKTTRGILHDRARGLKPSDPPGITIISLAGRQLSRSNFIDGALDRLLPVVTACATCGNAASCPRLHGAKMLRKSKRARERLSLLLELLTHKGRHLSAREIWVFLIELFFGWTCPAGADDVERARGYFWSRIFDDTSRVAADIASEFDPVNAPMPREDAQLWKGDFTALNFDQEFPGGSPAKLAREERQDGLDAFESAKRAYFFFGKGVDAKRLLARQSLAPRFGRLLDEAPEDERRVIREVVTLINGYRVASRSANELWISRHHSLAAHRRPGSLAAAYKLPIEKLDVRIPFAWDATAYPEAGYFPDRLLLRWEGSEQVLVVSFDTWERLQHQRSLTVDRDQESLDFALDLFMAQAPVPALEDPEILFYDHARGEQITIRVKPAERRIELL